jgi:hypothetical protein
MVTVALGKSYVKRNSALRRSVWRNEVIDFKGFQCLSEDCYRLCGVLIIEAGTKNAGLATVTLISAPNPVSQVLW